MVIYPNMSVIDSVDNGANRALPEPLPSKRPISFGPFELDAARGELRKRGVRVKLQDQPFQILHILLETPGEIVTRETLKNRVWPVDTFVDFDKGLYNAVKKLREALEDMAGTPRFIETIPKRGYRFIATIGKAQYSPELVPGFAPSDDKPENVVASPEKERRETSKFWVIAGATSALVAAAIGVVLFLRTPSVQIGRGIQITNDGRAKKVKEYWIPSLVTDGARLYFNELISGNIVIAQVSAAGGETAVIPTSLRSPQLLDISPRGSELLVTSGDSYPDNPLWVLPLPEGSPRRLGSATGSEASWSPDGHQIAYIKDQAELHLVNADGNADRTVFKKANLPKYILHRVTFSPDGGRIRFDLKNLKSDRTAFWEVNADGQAAHAVLPETWNNAAGKCCERWTVDSKYVLFQSDNENESNLWIEPDCRPSPIPCKAHPVRLTNGPLRYTNPLPSKDAKRVFTIGVQKRAELVRYDPRTGQYGSYLSGISAGHLSFSSDGQWVAWINYPENTLWCSKADGSERRQLTYPPLLVLEVRWSRDGSRIALTALQPGQAWRIYTISRDGGAIEPVLVEERSQLGPTWAPDDSSIAFGRILSREDSMGIEIVDMNLHKVSDLPGSQNLWGPSWSPDGRYLAAVTADMHHLAILNFKTGKWTKLTQSFAHIWNHCFSHDGKYVYFEDVSDSTIYRARIDDATIQRVASFQDLRRPAMSYWPVWFGLAPDDSLLAMRDLGSEEIYAFDLQK